MNEQQLAAVKLALEALEWHESVWAAYRYRSTETSLEAITALQPIIAQHALYKMAEESRTSGLRLDDWDKIGCVNHDCDQCKAVQEPVAQSLKDAVFTVIEGFNIPPDVRKILESAYYNAPPAPQPVPVKTYHDGKPWPVAPKPWVGLTPDEMLEALTSVDPETKRLPIGFSRFACAIEAKLKEKNT